MTETDICVVLRALSLRTIGEEAASEIERLRRLADSTRLDVIEECAKACDQLSAWALDLYSKDTIALRLPSPYQHMMEACDECAERIRYLKEAPTSPLSSPHLGTE